MAKSQALIFALALSFVGTSALAKDYTFKDLAMYDYEQMEKIVRQKLGSATIDDLEREPKVRSAIKVVFSRHNTDGKRTALFLNLQGQLPETFFTLSLQKLAEESIATLTDKDLSNEVRATSLLVLENMLAEIKPRARDYAGIIEKIRDAKIEISGSLLSFRRLEGMDTNQSPSEIAKNILERVEEEQKAVAKDADDKVVAKNGLSDLAD